MQSNTTDEEYLDSLERENITLASFSKRTTAFIIDDILIGIIIVIALWNIISGQDDIELIINQINKNIVYIFILKFLYHSFFIWYYGQTIGKMVTKIRAIELDTLDSPSLIQACIRSAIRLASEFLFYIGFLFFFISIINQTMHDKLGKTIIVNDI